MRNEISFVAIDIIIIAVIVVRNAYLHISRNTRVYEPSRSRSKYLDKICSTELTRIISEQYCETWGVHEVRTKCMVRSIFI